MPTTDVAGRVVWPVPEPEVEEEQGVVITVGLWRVYGWRARFWARVGRAAYRVMAFCESRIVTLALAQHGRE